MAKLNGDFKKWKRGELCGTVATVFCAAVFVCFAVCFTLARVKDYPSLQLASLIAAPVLIAAGVAVAAFCNLKYGKAVEKAVSTYVLENFVDNAALLRPEKSSLTFYLHSEENRIILQVNGFKDKIEFDFSPLGNLSAVRKANLLSAIENRLCITFCRLYERGAEYSDVGYCEREGTRRKSGKTTYIIKNGTAEKTAFRYYIKNKEDFK